MVLNIIFNFIFFMHWHIGQFCNTMSVMFSTPLSNNLKINLFDSFTIVGSKRLCMQISASCSKSKSNCCNGSISSRAARMLLRKRASAKSKLTELSVASAAGVRGCVCVATLVTVGHRGCVGKQGC